MAERVDAAYQKVTCSGCGKEYTCTPDEDYYNSTTLEDGVCWDCLLKEGGVKPQPEPPYRSLHVCRGCDGIGCSDCGYSGNAIPTS